MPTDTKPSPRELRRQAKALKIRGWEDMSTKQLAKAVEAKGGEVPTQSTKTKSSTKAKSNGKADKPAKSTKTKSKAKDDDAEIAENGNPFKEGTNLWYITEQLIKGGKRSDMVRRLKKQIELRPRTNADDFDLDYEMDRRVLIIGQLLRNKHGFDVEREGRGPDAEIVATPPS